MKLSGYLILVFLIACRCKESTEELPTSQEFGNMATFVPNGYPKIVEMHSSNGLTEKLSIHRTQTTEIVDNYNCKQFTATYPKLSYNGSQYGFSISLDITPIREGDRINLNQSFWNQNNDVRGSTFTFDINANSTIFNSWSNLNGQRNNLDSKISHQVIDTFSTLFQKYKAIHFFSNPGWHNVPDPRAIVEFYVDKNQGLVRFKTKDENVWDIKY